MPLRVVELFAGVGGFRIGLEGAPGSKKNPKYAVVWSNQWEPATLKSQHASDVYAERWGMEVIEEEKDIVKVSKKVKGKKVETEVEVTYKTYSSKETDDDIHLNKDIGKVDAKDIPDHDLLVGGFPCQDYSVAKTAKDAAGIEGKKGVLWWEIHRILTEKKPSYVLLENVDRLLKSPTSQRGRDFAVMLASFAELGYIIEWRVINAADYGMPQRRRRVFIMAYAPGTPQYESLKDEGNIKQWMEKDGLFAKAFPINPLNILIAHSHQIKGPKDKDLADVSDNFNKGANPKAKSPFKKSGIMVGNNYYTYDTIPNYSGKHKTLGEILLPPKEIPDEYVIDPTSILKEKGWKYLKGAKDEPRKGTDDFTYQYKEGPMIFPDALDKPSRTIVTGEGGSTPSRFKHVVKFKPTKKMKESFDLETKECQVIRKEFGLAKSEWLRRLTPVELELLNMFPPNHTAGPTDGKRAFFMGNALVCGIVKRIGKYLIEDVEKPKNVFEFLSSKLLELTGSEEPSFIWEGANGVGFTWRGYDGTQAKKKLEQARKLGGIKQGLFDFFIDTTVRRGDDIEFKYGHEGATHRDILQDLLDKNLLEEARRVWKGEFPHAITGDAESIETLAILALMMLEQEVNWGGITKAGGLNRIRNVWQRNSPYFYPLQGKRSLERRQRDCLMAYIEWAFEEQSIEGLEFWIETGGRTTLSPTNPTDREKSSRLMQYRDSFGEEGGAPLMSGENLQAFKNVAEKMGNNPHLSD